MNFLFIIILLFVVVKAYLGYKKGIMRMVLSVSAFLISSLAMLLVAPYLSDVLIANDNVINKIKTPIYEVVAQQFEEGADVSDIINEYHLPEKLNSSIEELVKENLQEKQNSAASAVTQYLAEYICRIISYIIVFAVVRILLQFLTGVIKIFEHLPVVHELNNIGGMTLGLVEAVGCIWLFFMIVDVFHATQFGIVVRTMIWDSQALRLLYNKNPLFIFIR